MLSFSQAKILLDIEYLSYVGSNKDGRSIHALRTRGYITKVEWDQAIETYTFKVTAKGKKISRQLHFISRETLEEILS